MMLKQGFDLETSSIYKDDMRMLKHEPELVSYVGHTERSDDNDNEIEIVKTHDHDKDDNKAIYIVRDGRSSVVSYFHFLREIEKSDISLEHVIGGSAWPGSWADHIRSWDPHHRKRTLLIRYEDMISNPLNVLKEIEPFIGCEQRRDFHINFEKLHSSAPLFFRKGSNEDAFAEIAPYIDLFNKHNGEMMKNMRYY